MTNDDPEYLRDLERARDSMECEIRSLEYEISQRDGIIAELQKANNPTHMGEPVITKADGYYEGRVHVLRAFLARTKDPDDLGWAVMPEVREEAKKLLEQTK